MDAEQTSGAGSTIRSAVRPQIIQLPRISDPRGNLTAINGGVEVPFEIRRIFYLYDVPGGEARAGHAHYSLQELIIAASGSFDVTVDDGQTTSRFFLNRAYQALYLPGMLWRTIENFSSGAVCLVLASTEYDESDYIRDYDEFLRARGR